MTQSLRRLSGWSGLEGGSTAATAFALMLPQPDASGGGVVTIPLSTALRTEVLSNLRRDLTIRHLVDGLNADDAPAQLVSHETFLQLVLGLPRAKD
jgi:hypothetical protein